ncbi:MAG TPA: acetate--CoA ligase family protein [Pseudolabrys sp.]|nr:acetate--CoA ligase family protein [Pseudolabrys sp.]
MPDIGKLLAPQSVAVIGASSDLQGLRGRIFQIIRSHPFEGRVYPVSRSATEVQGVKAYASVEALPETPDLAILIVPAVYVPAELERCGRAGIKAVVILSSGFAEEPGGSGSRMQEELRATAKRFDMAVAGPNSEGFANIASAFCPTFSPVLDAAAGPIVPKVPLGRGQVSVISQSGGLGFAFFDRARPRNLLFRHIVTTGNEAALDVADVLDWMLDEKDGADVVLLIIEDVKSPAKFRRAAAKALALGKPLIVAKIGRSEPGSRAVLSHTAALAGSHAAYRAVFEHDGLIEGRDIDEMLDLTAGFLACGDRLPAGHRVGICTASGGAGVWMADACADAGLEVPVLDAATRAKIDVGLPSYASSLNPVDVTAQGVHQFGYAEYARLLSAAPGIDGVVTVITARRSAFLEHDLPKLEALARNGDKPVLMWSYTIPSERSVEILNSAGYALFTNARGCALTMRAMSDFRARREARRVRQTTPHPARAQVAAKLAAAGGVLTEHQARPLLATYGIGDDDGGRLVHSADDAVAAARAIGRSVALKVQSSDILHKTEAGAVALDLPGESVRDGFARVLANAKRHAPAARIDGVLVQPMAAPGREIILGINRDPTWGPLLMVGLGGVLVEALGDVALAPVPLDAADAHDLIARLKAAPVLGAHRGTPAADIDALAALMVRLSQFATDHAETIAQIDLNPVIVHARGQGVSIVDALIVKHVASEAKEMSHG